VYVLNKDSAGLNRADLREIAAGVTINQLTEIKTGIAVGDVVLIQGQQFISDGAPVRVIASAGNK
jgi:hypothetical protein